MNPAPELFRPDAGSPRPRPLVGYMERELRAVAAPAADFRLLESIWLNEDREKVHAFLLCLRTPAGARVLAQFEKIAARIIRRGWNLPLGCETLRGVARGTLRGFVLNNDFAPLFVAALRAKRPEWSFHIELCAPLARLVLSLGWSPSANE